MTWADAISALDNLRRALPNLTWKRSDDLPAPAEGFIGDGDGWRVVVASAGPGHADGMASNVERGLVLHLTPELALEGLKFARKACPRP